MATAITPTAIDVARPAITRRARRGRTGRCRRDGRPTAIASARDRHGERIGRRPDHAHAATVISASVSRAPSVNVTCRQGLRLVIPDARIEREIRQIHHEVDGDDGGGDDYGHALHHRRSRAVIAPSARRPRPGSAKTDSRTMLPRGAGRAGAGDGDDGNQGVAERVPGDDSAFGHAFRSRGAHVVLAQHVEHGRARGAREDGGLEHAERSAGRRASRGRPPVPGSSG